MSPSELGQALAAQRRREPKVCEVCGTSFEGLAKSRYCSVPCNQRAYWDRKRPELNAKRRERYRRTKSASDARASAPYSPPSPLSAPQAPLAVATSASETSR